ncbi:D-alanyl-D-alanine carboxypeptidase-like protein [Cricetibacter osteomyelitidis]|uniref:D-alanyl-D-alanine carboxypeptidase-like protein n=1 Tax=Cricetibacter osteomyelitidis TaxID=1521931 RepID=A0A4R2SG91_9PAST|nr:D-alanyl-D-alanine carboxypeptidase-like protein [Cricetibacter osteomyelitidis]
MLNNLSSDGKIYPGQILKLPIINNEIKSSERTLNIKQKSSLNKSATPVAKAEISEPIIKNKHSSRNEEKINALHPQVRSIIRQFLNEVYKIYKIQLVIVQGYRTYEEQNKLYAQGRTLPGNIVTKAKGGQSNHNFGLAIDVFPVWDDGKLHMDAKSDDQNIKILKMISPIGIKNGLSWGGNWKSFKDYPHFEVSVGKTLSELREEVKKVGGNPLNVIYNIK